MTTDTLPRLVGTDRQVEWAERIRADRLAVWHRQLETLSQRWLRVSEMRAVQALPPEDQDKVYRAVAALRDGSIAKLNAIRLETSAGWWIEHRDSSLSGVVTRPVMAERVEILAVLKGLAGFDEGVRREAGLNLIGLAIEQGAPVTAGLPGLSDQERALEDAALAAKEARWSGRRQEIMRRVVDAALAMPSWTDRAYRTLDAAMRALDMGWVARDESGQVVRVEWRGEAALYADHRHQEIQRRQAEAEAERKEAAAAAARRAEAERRREEALRPHKVALREILGPGVSVKVWVSDRMTARDGKPIIRVYCSQAGDEDPLAVYYYRRERIGRRAVGPEELVRHRGDGGRDEELGRICRDLVSMIGPRTSTVLAADEMP